MIETTAFCKDESGKLMAFEVSDVASYDAAIRAVRRETGRHRVLCLVRAAVSDNKEVA